MGKAKRRRRRHPPVGALKASVVLARLPGHDKLICVKGLAAIEDLMAQGYDELEGAYIVDVKDGEDLDRLRVLLAPLDLH